MPQSTTNTLHHSIPQHAIGDGGAKGGGAKIGYIPLKFGLLGQRQPNSCPYIADVQQNLHGWLLQLYLPTKVPRQTPTKMAGSFLGGKRVFVTTSGARDMECDLSHPQECVVWSQFCFIFWSKGWGWSGEGTFHTLPSPPLLFLLSLFCLSTYIH